MRQSSELFRRVRLSRVESKVDSRKRGIHVVADEELVGYSA